MKALSGMLSSWSHCIFQCCQPMASHFDNKFHGRDDFNSNSFSVIHDEPSFMPRPSAMPVRNTQEACREERAPKKRRGPGWPSFSARKPLLSSNTSLPRRPHISPPSNFRHVYSHSFHFPDSTSSQPMLQATPFRPLRLNINLSDTQLSPILPHLEYLSPPVTPPPRVYTISSPSDSGSRVVSHQRSSSPMSFSIPRRPVNGGSVFESPRSNTSTPQRPQPVKSRGTASPSPPPPPIVENLVERVANAMLERDKLQEQIDGIEKQYIHASSRPSTGHGQPDPRIRHGGESLKQDSLTNTTEMEPMPEIPVLPPNAPSFSERLSTDRIQTTSAPAPSRTRYQANSSRKLEGRAPPPPLPLRLRPPLRKKKSFSRVSSWLFPAGAEHRREISLDSITNAPKPVTGGQGFYQVARPESNRRTSFDTESTVSDWTVEEQTILTSLSPSNATTPRTLVGPPKGMPLGLQEPIRFQYRKPVGVAF
ncbi:hypothetical protein F4802DRAFT_227484 [Xylaria palmicola]|nr:hypothetical protein F4802DRAFT_227484 [Xylaria palmicola]